MFRHKFPLGKLVATPAALELLSEIGKNPAELVQRHASGDWGTVDKHDSRENEESVKHGFRILSAYEVPSVPARKIWIITEADRSSTCILLPEEY